MKLSFLFWTEIRFFLTHVPWGISNFVNSIKGERFCDNGKCLSNIMLRSRYIDVVCEIIYSMNFSLVISVVFFNGCIWKLFCKIESKVKQRPQPLLVRLLILMLDCSFWTRLYFQRIHFTVWTGSLPVNFDDCTPSPQEH